MSISKVALITGCNTGIGKQTAIEQAGQGYEAIMLVRDSEKSRDAFQRSKRFPDRIRYNYFMWIWLA